MSPNSQKYHEWMTSAELQELTASESLTLEQEYEMQRKWQEDEDKLTFIILAAPSLNRSGDLDRNSSDGADIQWEAVRALPMAGDVNLFMKGSRDEDDFEAEVEIMIAENAYRRRGFASSALQLMLSYATSSTSPSPLPISRDRLVVRIGEKNTPSIRLFEKLGFGITKRVEVFGEVEMRMGAGVVEWKEGERRVLRR